MKKHIYFFYFLLFCVSSVSSQNKVPIDLDRALQMAAKNNIDLKISQIAIQKSKIEKLNAVSSLLPTIDVVGKYQRTIKKQTMYLNTGDMPPIFPVPNPPGRPDSSGSSDKKSKVIPIQFGQNNDYSVGITSSLALFVPAAWVNLKLSETNFRQACEEAQKSKINVFNLVKKTYFGALLARDSYKLFKETYDMDSLILDMTKKKFAQGIVAEYDVLSADVKFKEDIPNLYQSETLYKTAVSRLKLLTGINENDEIIFSDSLIGEYQKQEAKLQINDSSAYRLNSDLKTLNLMIEKADMAYSLSKLNFAPSIAINFAYFLNSQSNDFKFKDYRWSPYSFVGVSVSFPIFHGGKLWNDLKKSKMSINQLKWKKEDLKQNLKLQHSNFIDMIAKNKKKIEVSRDAINKAEKAYSISKKRYETGMGTIIELNAASVALMAAKLQYKNSIFDYLSSRSDLEVLQGRTSF